MIPISYQGRVWWSSLYPALPWLYNAKQSQIFTRIAVTPVTPENSPNDPKNRDPNLTPWIFGNF